MEPNPVPLLRTLQEHSQLPPNYHRAPGTGHPCPVAPTLPAVNPQNEACGLSQDTHHSTSPSLAHPNHALSPAMLLQPAEERPAGLTPKQSVGGEKGN